MLPLLTPDIGTLIVLAYLGGLREKKGVKWCRYRGIGGARKYLRGNRLDLADFGMVTLDRDPNALKKRIVESQMLLALQCRLCGQCELAEKEP